MKKFKILDKIQITNSYNEEICVYQIWCDEEILNEIKSAYDSDVWVGKKTLFVTDTLLNLIYLKYHEPEGS